MGVLDDLFVSPFFCFSCCHILFSVIRRDVFSYTGVSLFRYPSGIRTQIGNDSDGAIPFDVNSLIELLGNPHRL